MGHFDDRRSAGDPGRGDRAVRYAPAARWPVPGIRVQPGTSYIYR